MATLKRGDDVITVIEIINGAFTPNVKKGAKGTVLTVKSGNKVEVHFPSAGVLWPKVTCDVETMFLNKV